MRADRALKWQNEKQIGCQWSSTRAGCRNDNIYWTVKFRTHPNSRLIAPLMDVGRAVANANPAWVLSEKKIRNQNVKKIYISFLSQQSFNYLVCHKNFVHAIRELAFIIRNIIATGDCIQMRL